MDQLSNPSLLAVDAFIGGEFRPAGSGRTFSVTDPANGTTLGSVADCDKADALDAVSAATHAFPDWARLTTHQRADILMAWHDLIMDNADDLAKLMTAEQGKVIAEARSEVVYGAQFISWFAEEGKRAYGQVIPPTDPSSRIVVLRQPVGVSAAITPWNFPNAMITRKAAPALAAGCTFIVKPAEDTPLSALALAVLADEAGVPPGVFNVVPTSRPEAVGEVLTTDSRIAKFSFTGSTAVGKTLLAQTASTVKNVSLELGGNAPFLVFDDADLEAAVEGAVAAKYRNTGQTCICVNRFLVQESVAEAFTSKLASASRALVVGSGMDATSDVGPLINDTALTKVEQLVSSAVSGGATVHVGGVRSDHGSLFYEPTVLSGVQPTMEIARSEIFGPVSAITTFDTETEGVRMANDTRFGLAAYFYTGDTARAWRVAEALEYGMVGVNSGRISTPVAPFGGWKESGIGREGSSHGLDEYLETKYVSFSVGQNQA